MSLHIIWRLAKSEYLKLVPVLALAFYVALLPHLNYPYPVHVDEWVHLASFKAMLRAHDATFIDPFSGQLIRGLSSNLEAGFHVFWGVFHQISGISWLTIFKYFPGIVLIITVLSVYTMARRQGFGWEAALVTSLIPTTVGILGPGFLVPVAMGLLVIPLSLFIAFNFRNRWSYVVLFIFTCFLLSIHPPTAVGLAIVLVPYILLNLKGNFKHSMGITLAMAIPFLVPFPWIFGMLLPTVKSLLGPQPPLMYVDLPHLVSTYGHFPIGFCLLGIFVLAIRGRKENYGLILGFAALLLMLVAFYTFHYGVRIMYTRGLTYMVLLMSIVAGAGLMAVKNFKLPQRLSVWLRAPLITQNLGKFLCIVLIGLTLATCIPDRQDIPYYHMIDSQDYEAFMWIKDNVNESYEKAILDPWKATAFAATTEKYVYTRIHTAPDAEDKEAYAFLRNGCTDTAFMRENEISIVYTQWAVNNPDLKEVRKDIYLLPKADSQ